MEGIASCCKNYVFRMKTVRRFDKQYREAFVRDRRSAAKFFFEGMEYRRDIFLFVLPHSKLIVSDAQELVQTIVAAGTAKHSLYGHWAITGVWSNQELGWVEKCFFSSKTTNSFVPIDAVLSFSLVIVRNFFIEKQQHVIAPTIRLFRVISNQTKLSFMEQGDSRTLLKEMFSNKKLCAVWGM